MRTRLAKTAHGVGGSWVGALSKYRDLRKGFHEKELVRIWHGNGAARPLLLVANIHLLLIRIPLYRMRDGNNLYNPK